jgi:hypothetical protein
VLHAEAYKGYGENKWYFFTVREPSSSNKEEEPNRKVRVPGVKATWKATGSLVPISVEGGERQQEEPGAVRRKEKVVVGTKRVLIYQSSDAEEDGKWSMHEYILKGHAKVRIRTCIYIYMLALYILQIVTKPISQ